MVCRRAAKAPRGAAVAKDRALADLAVFAAAAPAPQWSVDAPQKPLAEQQSPKADPLHVFPLLPQVPSVEILSAVAQVPNPDWHPAPQCAVVPPQNPLEEQQSPKLDPLQVPKALWQAVPQWADESPHQFPDEQHAPKVELVQMNWFEPPQVPSGDASPGPGGFTGGGGGASQFPKVGWLRTLD
ncbi:hypothetical protein D7B24_003382 [Verticillium nonalfalfae]|uniref:Uncharacterized protein n=1 Tax=Verticillium nonalfalfae TaxID=1051616 RepID=A0A3M9XX62_9PEZI|nr:uncharacterized protein D7B24_003382 [Verticillium nonalfalfae]RNJ52495.1 hypothetical protein D7B24_003382 [Verticillium nonalfalfae]